MVKIYFYSENINKTIIWLQHNIDAQLLIFKTNVYNFWILATNKSQKGNQRDDRSLVTYDDLF